MHLHNFFSLFFLLQGKKSLSTKCFRTPDLDIWLIISMISTAHSLRTNGWLKHFSFFILFPSLPIAPAEKKKVHQKFDDAITVAVLFPILLSPQPGLYVNNVKNSSCCYPLSVFLPFSFLCVYFFVLSLYISFCLYFSVFIFSVSLFVFSVFQPT